MADRKTLKRELMSQMMPNVQHTITIGTIQPRSQDKDEVDEEIEFLQEQEKTEKPKKKNLKSEIKAAMGGGK